MQQQGMPPEAQSGPDTAGATSCKDRGPPVLESTVTQDRTGGQVGNHKNMESGASQPQDMGASPGQDSNNGCNVQGAFPPSLGERQSTSGPVKTRGRR